MIIIPDSAFGSFRQLSERDIEINSANAPRFNTIPWRPGESSGQVAPGRFHDLLLLFFFFTASCFGILEGVLVGLIGFVRVSVWMCVNRCERADTLTGTQDLIPHFGCSKKKKMK